MQSPSHDYSEDRKGKLMASEFDKIEDLVEKVGFQVRTVMMQAHKVHNEMWSIPARYAPLASVCMHARLDAPLAAHAAADAVDDADADADADDDDGVVPFNNLQQLGDSSSSDVEITRDSSLLSLADLEAVMDGIFKKRKRLSAKSAASLCYSLRDTPLPKKENVYKQETNLNETYVF